MAIGDHTDFKIYEPEFYSGLAEGLAQNLSAFNAASQGAIRLVPQQLKGHYEKESFFKDIAGLITRRNIGSVSAATDLEMPMDENISVKINRKIGPVAHTLDSWRKLGVSPQEMSLKLGRMVGEHQVRDYLNTALLAVETALDGQTAVETDVTGASPNTLAHQHMVTAMSKFGDASQRIACWVMHSKPWHNLIGQAIVDKIFNVADVAIYGGGPGTLGKPVIVTDAPALWDLNGSAADTYNVLGLVPGAVTVKESEEREIHSQIVTGLENIVLRIQGEYAFNLGVKGFKYDVTGGINPDDSTIGTTTNWDKVVTSEKDLAGIRLVVR